MQTLHQWFESIAFALNDDEPDHAFTRYPLQRMVQAYNAGILLVYKYREDLFTEWKIVKLTPGQYQDTRGCCDKILEVAEQTDANGNTIKDIGSKNSVVSKGTENWNKPSCLSYPDAPSGYTVESVELDMEMDGRFKVTPTVPCDTEVYVRVKCVAGPCPISEADIEGTAAVNSVMLSALWFFVLAQMQAGDRYTETPFTNMRYNHGMFFKILEVVQKKEDEFETPEGE